MFNRYPHRYTACLFNGRGPYGVTDIVPTGAVDQLWLVRTVMFNSYPYTYTTSFFDRRGSYGITDIISPDTVDQLWLVRPVMFNSYPFPPCITYEKANRIANVAASTPSFD